MHRHLPFYLPGFDEAEVVGVWDRVPARVANFARSIGATPFKWRAALLDHQSIEFAFVFGNPWEMLDNARECPGRRIPISVENPAAPSLQRLVELIWQAERVGVRGSFRSSSEPSGSRGRSITWAR